MAAPQNRNIDWISFYVGPLVFWRAITLSIASGRSAIPLMHPPPPLPSRHRIVNVVGMNLRLHRAYCDVNKRNACARLASQRLAALIHCRAKAGDWCRFLFVAFRQAQQRCSLLLREDTWTLRKYCWTEEHRWMRRVRWVDTLTEQASGWTKALYPQIRRQERSLSPPIAFLFSTTFWDPY